MNPISIFASTTKASRFWFGMFLVMVGVLIFERYLLVQNDDLKKFISYQDNEGNIHVLALTNLEDAKAVHDRMVTLAVKSLLDRNPTGVDNESLLGQIYAKGALKQAHELVNKESQMFYTYNVHQKCEIGKIKLLKTDKDRIIVQVIGQLIRVGRFNDQKWDDPLNFGIALTLQRNPAMGDNNRLSYVVKVINKYKTWKDKTEEED